MTNTEKIIKLNTIWYTIIGQDHHKDRDCHFRISQHFFYGDKLEWEVEHYGYIIDNYDSRTFNTQEEAEQSLMKLLHDSIIDECKFHLDDLNNEHKVTTFTKEELEEYLLEAKRLFNQTYCRSCKQPIFSLPHDGKCEKCYDNEYSGCYGGGCIGGE